MALRSKETALDRHRAVVSVATTAAALPTSDDLTALAEGVFLVDPSGVPITPAGSPSTTGTPATVAASATSVTLLAANAARRGGTIVNESTAILYVLLGTPATATSYTVALAPMGTVGSYYEIPFNYTGIVTGIWASATGNARVTELT